MPKLVLHNASKKKIHEKVEKNVLLVRNSYQDHQITPMRKSIYKQNKRIKKTHLYKSFELQKFWLHISMLNSY